MELDKIFLYGSYLLRLMPVITTVFYILPRQIEELRITRKAEEHMVYFIALVLFGFSIVYLIALLASIYVTFCRVSSCGNYNADVGAFLYSFGFFAMNIFGVALYFKEQPSQRIATLLQKRVRGGDKNGQFKKRQINRTIKK